MLRWVMAIGLAVAAPAVASAQDADAGKKVFVRCAACHKADATNSAGPGLAGIFGRKPGSHEGFEYSAGMKKYGESNTWDDTTLDAYLSQTASKTVPGTKMVFPGIKDEGQRADLIAYLKTLK